MAKDFAALADALDRVAVAVTQDVNQLVGDVVAAVHYDVAEGTPVDTGKARTNWIARLATPFQFIYNPYSPIPSKWRPPYNLAHPGRAETANLRAGQAQVGGIIARRQPDQDVYITNNAPYIARLNAGHSRQSAAGFVEQGVASGVSRAVREFKFPNLRKLR